MGRTTKINLVGKTFGRLYVVEEVLLRDKHNHIKYLCRCSCGKYKEVSGQSLRRSTRSCGCLQRESARTHGQEGTPTYKTWVAMKSRCNSSSSTNYKNYGGRGITICPSWVNSFEQFHKDMGDRPSNMSLERVDNNGGYSKENCIWATATTQANNRRRSIKIKYKGVTMNIKEYAELIGLTPSGAMKRLKHTLIKVNGVFLKEGDY